MLSFWVLVLIAIALIAILPKPLAIKSPHDESEIDLTLLEEIEFTDQSHVQPEIIETISKEYPLPHRSSHGKPISGATIVVSTEFSETVIFNDPREYDPDSDDEC